MLRRARDAVASAPGPVQTTTTIADPRQVRRADRPEHPGGHGLLAAVDLGPAVQQPGPGGLHVGRGAGLGVQVAHPRVHRRPPELPSLSRGSGSRSMRASGATLRPPWSAVTSSAASGGQGLEQPGQQRIDTGRGLMPLRRADTEHMGRGVQVGGVAVDQPGPRGSSSARLLGIVVGRAASGGTRAPRYAASVSPLPMNAAGSTARAPIPCLPQPLEPGWQRLPFGWAADRRATDVGEHPVGAGDVEREAQDAVLAGLRAGAQRHQAGGRGRREGAEQFGSAVRRRRRERRRAAARRRPTPATGASPSRRPG